MTKNSSSSRAHPGRPGTSGTTPRANADKNLSDLYATLDRNKSTVSSHTSEITTQATEETNQPENKREMAKPSPDPAKQTPRTRKRRADSSHNTHVTCRASSIRHWKNKKSPNSHVTQDEEQPEGGERRITPGLRHQTGDRRMPSPLPRKRP